MGVNTRLQGEIRQDKTRPEKKNQKDQKKSGISHVEFLRFFSEKNNFRLKTEDSRSRSKTKAKTGPRQKKKTTTRTKDKRQDNRLLTNLPLLPTL